MIYERCSRPGRFSLVVVVVVVVVVAAVVVFVFLV